MMAKSNVRSTIATVMNEMAPMLGIRVLADDGNVVFRNVLRDALEVVVVIQTLPGRARIEFDHQFLVLASPERIVEYIDEQVRHAAARARGALLLFELDQGLQFDFATDDDHAVEHIERAATKLADLSTQLMALLAKARTR